MESASAVPTSRDIVQNLTRWASLLRYDTVRMIANARSGHPGGCLSMADIMACLYFHVMRLRPDDPQWADRDRFILSKGHAAPVLYASLARRGFFELSELKNLRKAGSFLHGHPEIFTPGVDMTSGSLGQGLSAAVGMAMAGRLDGKNYRVFVVLGCGELDEGQVWEAAASSNHFQLDRIVAILDYNKLQFDGPIKEVCDKGDVSGRWRCIGWNVIEIDGHNIEHILSAIHEADESSGTPTIIIAHTIKGKGVPFMENDYLWHSLMDLKKLNQFVEDMKIEFEQNPDSFYAQSLW